jgi:hypothetical protein
MPLSEDEQRILHDIERSFYESDPKFAQAVSTSGLYRHASRKCKLSAVGFFLSLALLLGSFFKFPVLGLVGFVAMLACAAVFTQNLRRIGASGLKDVAESERARQAGQSLHEFRARWNSRFKR